MDSQLQQLIRENLYLRAVPCKIRPRTHTHTYPRSQRLKVSLTLRDGKGQSNQSFLCGGLKEIMKRCVGGGTFL